MTDIRRLTDGIEAAITAARADYRRAVVALAGDEAAKSGADARDLADVDRIHHARTRVIALEAAREELARIGEEGDAPSA